MKAIMTKYLPCTNTKGSRIKAYAEGVKPLSIGYDHAAHDPHVEAALALCRRQGWTGELIEGGRPDQKGSVFVFAHGERHAI